MQLAGGWQRVFLSQLDLQRLELPNATLQLNAAQRFITNFVFCDRPLIAEQTSEFQTFTNNFPLGTLHKEFVVEPLASIIINGCGFGPDAGEVRLVLNQDTGSFLSLQINNWSDSSIFATLAANPGIPDQPAQLVVIRKDGTQSVPMPVDFFQHRMFHVTVFIRRLTGQCWNFKRCDGYRIPWESVFTFKSQDFPSLPRKSIRSKGFTRDNSPSFHANLRRGERFSNHTDGAQLNADPDRLSSAF